MACVQTVANSPLATWHAWFEPIKARTVPDTTTASITLKISFWAFSDCIAQWEKHFHSELHTNSIRVPIPNCDGA